MIGSEIEIDPTAPVADRGDELEIALDAPAGRSAWFGCAREAVRWWADHLKPPGPMLLPAYCCESVVQPFREAGVEVRFYPVRRDLTVDGAAVRDLARGAAAIQVIHYFGFPARRELFDLGIPVLEDAVQALLTPWARSQGQWAIASLRKFLPVPDGALLVSREAFAAPALPEATVGVYDRKRQWRIAKHAARVSGDAPGWWEACRQLEGTEHELDGPIVPRAMSAASRLALRGVDLGAIATRRRQNYRALHELLFSAGRDPAGVTPLYSELPEAVVPYGLPILSERRDELKAHLADQGLYTVIHWDLPRELTRSDFPDSWWLYDRILTLPTDHRYGAEEMRRIDSAVRHFSPGGPSRRRRVP